MKNTVALFLIAALALPGIAAAQEHKIPNLTRGDMPSYVEPEGNLYTTCGEDLWLLADASNLLACSAVSWTVTGECTGANGGALTVNASNQVVCSDDDGGAGGGAPTDAEYVTTAAHAGLSAERVFQAGTNTTVTTGVGTVQVDVSGVLPDARISESSVTQHQAALSVTESQISDLAHMSDTGPAPDCVGTSTYQDGEGGCDAVGGDVSGGLDALAVTDNSHAHTGTTISALDAGDTTTGTFADARISQTSVTQHEAALTVTESQVSDLTHTNDTTCSGVACTVGADDTVSGAAVTLEAGASPTADGQIQWDSTAESIKVGDDGVATLEFVSGAHTTQFTPDADPGVDHASYVAGHGDGANCSAGNYPLGMDGAGAAQSCTPDDDVPEAGDYSNLTAGRSLTAPATGTLDADAELYTDTFTFVLETPATGDSGVIQHAPGIAGTITRIQCSTDTGTVDINVEERALATPNSAGTDAMAADLQCDADSATQTSFANAAFDATDPLALAISATVSSPGWLRVHITFEAAD